MRQFVRELLEGVQRIENERSLLNEEMKELYEAYEDKLDVKAFKVALRIAKAKEKFGGSDMELDNILEAMD
tara:strand:+ start:787 stop:999 length:213 start_codon:yes stop_codon:yes gene_type:complete